MTQADEPWITSWADLVSRRIYLRVLAALLALIWLLLAIHPHDRTIWLSENTAPLLFVIALVATYRALPLSRTSYTLIALHLVLHMIGAHYTYSYVPWPEWLHALGFDIQHGAIVRNNYDRVVHFSYGLLLAYPFREILLRVANPRGFWGYLFPVALILATSAIYELVEWGVAEVFGGDLGVEFLGNQGDIWDAQKDMAVAGLGALIAMLIAGALNYALDRDFAREWNESLRVKISTPLGEDELWRLWCAWNKPMRLQAEAHVKRRQHTIAARALWRSWPRRLLKAPGAVRIRAARLVRRPLQRLRSLVTHRSARRG